MIRHTFKYDKLSVGDLVRLRDEIETAVKEKIAIERRELQARIGKVAALKPFPPRRQKPKPKYRGPKGELWTGRGLSPRWLVALEKLGCKREQFRIANEELTSAHGGSEALDAKMLRSTFEFDGSKGVSG
jgi:DNA-binding protein H-NS